MEGCNKKSVNNGLIEESVVFETYTVSHPRTVMVHSKNTHIALRAMMRTRGPKFLAFHAVEFRIFLFKDENFTAATTLIKLGLAF